MWQKCERVTNKQLVYSWVYVGENKVWGWVANYNVITCTLVSAHQLYLVGDNPIAQYS